MHASTSSPWSGLIGRLWNVRPTRHRRGAQLFRIVTGLTIVYQLAILFAQRHMLFGPDAIAPFDTFAAGFGRHHLSLLALSDDPRWLAVVYGATILVAAVWAAGYATRWLTPVLWLGFHSMHQRAHYLWDGGDNLILILLIYGFFMDLSVPRTQQEEARIRREVTVSSVLHNTALLACMIQVSIVYFVAGVTKLAGKYWVNGTAFYYVMNSEKFGFMPLRELIWDSPVLLTAATWGPVAMQLAFPFVYFFGRAPLRRALVLVAISFHVGIFAGMGLETFAIFMVASELLLLSDDDFAAIERGLGRLFGPVRRLLPSHRANRGADEIACETAAKGGVS